MTKRKRAADSTVRPSPPERPASEFLEINVGGRIFATTRATLCAEQGSMLATSFDPLSSFAPPVVDAEGRPFIDRDGDTFGHVLSYLRCAGRIVGLDTGDLLLLARIREEAAFFGLRGLEDAMAAASQSFKTEYEYRRVPDIFPDFAFGPTDDEYDKALIEEDKKQHEDYMNGLRKAGWRLKVSVPVHSPPDPSTGGSVGHIRMHSIFERVAQVEADENTEHADYATEEVAVGGDT
eukprot:COSAG05_NODE_3251_length_2202_cov_2.097295_1_plen_236_part_00